MNENISVYINGRDFECTPENTMLTRHIGGVGLSMYDNIKIEVGTVPPATARVYRHSDAYEPMETHLVENGYHLDVNRRTATQTDMLCHEAQVKKMVGSIDTVPDSWE